MLLCGHCKKTTTTNMRTTTVHYVYVQKKMICCHREFVSCVAPICANLSLFHSQALHLETNNIFFCREMESKKSVIKINNCYKSSPVVLETKEPPWMRGTAI